MEIVRVRILGVLATFVICGGSILIQPKGEKPLPACSLITSDMYVCAGRSGAEYERLIEWAEGQVVESAERAPLTYGEQLSGPYGEIRIEDRSQLRQEFMEGKAGEPSGEMLVQVLS